MRCNFCRGGAACLRARRNDVGDTQSYDAMKMNGMRPVVDAVSRAVTDGEDADCGSASWTGQVCSRTAST